MATLAALLRSRGHTVRGSDQNVYPPMSEFLAAEQIQTFSGYDAAHITPDLDLVVVGNAISRGNPELEAVLERKIRYCSLPEIIRDQFLWGAESVVVAGTHGKTTTTSLTAWLLTHGRLDPTVLVGGIALNFGTAGSSYHLGSGRHFVIEGDEYDSAFFDKTAKFLKYLPDIAIINNIEFDHADIYANLDEVRLAFRRLANLVPRTGLLLLGRDSPDAAALEATAVSPVETFGLNDGATWQAHDLVTRDGLTRFGVRRRGEPYGAFESPMLGVHNVRNALAAIAVGARAGLGPDDLAAGLRAFKGIKRRLETVGVGQGCHDSRRLRAPSDSGVRNTVRVAQRVSRSADLGRVRASLGVVLPARVSGGVCRGVRRRGRGHRRGGVPLVAARGGATRRRQACG